MAQDGPDRPQGRVVTGEEAERLRRSEMERRANLETLLSGEIIHFEDEANHFNASDLKRTYGAVLKTRRDGFGGRYWWIEGPPVQAVRAAVGPVPLEADPT